jgi:hypothetical protein
VRDQLPVAEDRLKMSLLKETLYVEPSVWKSLTEMP